jgi:excisionase family DNA binding protein
MIVIMENLSLETLPKAVNQLFNEFMELKVFLLENFYKQTIEADCWFDIDGLCIYLPDKPSKPTVYGWVSAGTIPVHKGGKKLRFLKSEIDNWLMQGKKKTLAEIAIEAELYCKTKKK